jgi:hypothetical protein
MHQIRFLTFQFLQNILKSTVPGAFSWGRSSRGKRFILNERPPKRMSNEFDSLDAREKAAAEGALKRCRVLADQIQSILRTESPHFVDKLSLAEFCASIERAADVLRKKSRRAVNNTPAPAVDSRARGRQRHR